MNTYPANHADYPYDDARARANKKSAAHPDVPRPAMSDLDGRNATPAYVPPASPRRLLTGMTSDERKKYPIVTGVLDYFPDAIAYVAYVSYLGNIKHNPGQPLHWARGKSMDHEDCIGRHTIERDTVEDDILHAGNRAWRALAALQQLLEKKHNLSLPRGATD